MANVMELLPEIPAGERAAISGVVNHIPEDSAQMFAMAYRAQRKDKTTVLLLTLLGFVAIAGVQRFVLGQIGMGFLFLLTAGLCFIGTIIDVVNHERLTTEQNVKVATEIANNLNMANSRSVSRARSR